jgi:sterol desaturase/sphingolipid hydroxylase (fatty acid hydroxylase superfamily)
MASIPVSWKQIINTYSPQTIEFTGTLLLQLLTFWLPAFFYLSLPYILPSFSSRHKLQSPTHQPTASELRDCFKVVLRNQVLSSLFHLLLLGLNAATGGRPSYRITATLPSWVEILRDFVSSIVLREIFFYYAHRLLHTPRFYKSIHKTHHRFTAPVSLSAQYAHPLEHFFANILPVSLPGMILHTHIVSFWVFLGFELWETATTHSGYDFLNGMARRHDAHHEKFNIWFGSFGWLDLVHGTGDQRKGTKEHTQNGVMNGEKKAQSGRKEQ